MQPKIMQCVRRVLRILQLMPALIPMLLAGACLSQPAAAADQTVPAQAAVQVSAPPPVASLAPLFVKPVTLRGTLDGVQIQMRLQLKSGETSALEGNYVVAGQNNKILLTGEFEEDALMMEESVNGKDVSGLWDGVYDGVALRGNWSSVDGSVLRAFVLKVVTDQR